MSSVFNNVSLFRQQP